MLSPKRTRYRKRQRRVRRAMLGSATRGNELSFGDHGLVSTDSAWITNRQIEAARIAMTRHIKRGGKVWIRIFPDMPYTKKPAETRMGKGKGSPEHWVAAVRPGTVMFEIAGVSNELAESAMRLASSKLPVRTKYVSRRGLVDA
jgi:large subunit ribosomal protein L16